MTRQYVAIALDFYGRYQHGIDGAGAGEVAVDGSRDAVPVELASLDDQQVEIAVGSHRPPRR
jgi:hypothetical protein